MVDKLTATITQRVMPLTKRGSARLRKYRQQYGGMLLLPSPKRAYTPSASLEDLLAGLVSMPTTEFDSASMHAAVTQVEYFLRDMGMYTEQLENGGLPILWATTHPNQKHVHTLLAAHIDVVNGPPEAFRLRKDGNRYYGRGVMDMKSSIAAYMHTVRALRGHLPDYDFGLLITCDEEVAGKHGTNGMEYILDQGYSADFVILPDGTENWPLESAAKGYVHFTLTATGTTGHGSRPWQASNALHDLMDALLEIRQTFTEPEPDGTTYNIGMIHGGDAPNRVPGIATADLEIRPTDMKARTHYTQVLTKICSRHGVTVVERTHIDPLVHDMNHPCMVAFRDCMRTVLGKDPGATRSFAGSDARYLLQRGIATAVFYPAGGNHHADDEWLDVAALPQLAEIIERYIRSTQQ